MKVLSSPEKKQILEKLKQEFGIENLPFLLIKFGKERVRAFSGSLSRDELQKLDRETRIESAGIYLLHDYGDEIRLSLDALHLLKHEIKKNIVELTKPQTEDWFKGQDVFLDSDISAGFKILKFAEDFIGCGKATPDGKIIKNYMPKERRIKN